MESSCHLSHLSVGLFVGLSACLSVWKVYCGKTAECIWISFGMVSGVGGGMGVIDEVHVPQEEGVILGVLVPIGLNGIFV